MLIIKGCLAIAEQCLYSDKAFSTSYVAPPVRTLSMYKKLGRNIARTADPKWQNFIPHDTIFIYIWKNNEKVEGDSWKDGKLSSHLSPLQMIESCFPGGGRMSACP